MQRYFIAPDQMQESICRIVGSDAHHIQKVMRYDLDDVIICSNGQGRTVEAKISEMNKDEIVCLILRDLEQHSELPLEITIAQGLPKGDKIEWIIQKGTELGAHSFLPFTSKRTIVKYDEKKEQKKVERWAKIAKEAAEQAHRERIPKIEPVCTLKDLLKIEAVCKLVAYEDEARQAHELPSSFATQLKSLKKGDSIVIVIGPEGGLDAQEVEQLKESGYVPVTLGSRILRTETASQYALSAISFYFEQMGG